MLNHRLRWIDQLRWQRLQTFQKLASMLLKHLGRHPEPTAGADESR